MPRKLSGVQRQVLGLYASFIRAAKTKPIDEQAQWIETIRQGFREGGSVKRNNFKKIEWLLRQGKKKLEQFENTSMKRIVPGQKSGS
mmetsp:Transcript_11708/g.21420  ORF Transcript_11708/g.21420 Transcript_11708/m.21420 type:complete len:87 (+) Transcript_11708:114-374(+)